MCGISIWAEKEKLTEQPNPQPPLPRNVGPLGNGASVSLALTKLPRSIPRKHYVMLTMEEAMKQSGALPFAAGNIVKGTIIEVRPKEVLVDIGYKSEGVISGNEFDDIKTVKIGDQIDVLIEKLEDKEGMVDPLQGKGRIQTELGTHPHDLQRRRHHRRQGQSHRQGRPDRQHRRRSLPARVADRRHHSQEPRSNTSATPTISRSSRSTRSARTSSSPAASSSSRNALERRQKLLDEMTPGDIRKGTVKNITDFGAFIDLNGIDGLLHITDMSWGRIGHPSEMLKVGQDIDVVVLDINREKERVSLGLKQKLANPWDSIEQKYPVGAKVKGKVVNLVPYGAFVELEPGVEGLVHVTELSWTKRIAKPSDVLKQDQEIEAVGARHQPRGAEDLARHPPARSQPVGQAQEKYPAGTRVKGKIRNLTSYGAFIELEEGIDGMIHVSDISWTRKINHPSEVLKKGDEVEAVVLEVDKANQRIALGIKQLSDDPWEASTSSTRSATSSRARSPSSPASARSSACSTRSTASSTSRRSARSAWTRSRTCSRSARKSPPASSRSTGATAASACPSRPPTTRTEQLKAEQAVLDALKPGEDLVALQHAFDAADEAKQDDTK